MIKIKFDITGETIIFWSKDQNRRADMPRPKKLRLVSVNPAFSSFVPENAPQTGETVLSVEGMEALRLSDVEGLDQDSGADLMGVSRQTYGRILSEARKRVAEALVTGKALRICGGRYEFRGRYGHCRRRRGNRGRPDS
jgi:uncharacterized protein